MKTLFIMYEGQVGPKEHVYRIVDTEPDHLIKMVPNFHVESKVKGSYAPGQIYSMEGEFNDKGGITYQKNTAQWIQAHPDCQTFSMLHNAYQATLKAERAAAPVWRDDLTNVREAYRKARGAQRSVILAQIIAAVTS